MEDMDIPLADELEWLESQRYREEEDDGMDPFPFPFPPDEEEDEVKFEGKAASESPQSVEPHINGHKRSSVQGELVGPCTEKRRRSTPVHEDDEDWLRYCPAGKSDDIYHRDQTASEPEEIMVSRYVSRIDGECLPVTAPNGDRVYAKLCRADTQSQGKKLISNFRSGGLISESVDVLLQRCEQEAFSKALHVSSEDQDNIKLPETPMLYEKLWVDKYAPNSFTELLSDEQTNREVLLWLKQWDSCVFGSEIRRTTDDVLSALRRHSSVSHHKKFANASYIWSSWSKEGSGHLPNLETKDSNSKWNQESWRNSRTTGPPEHKVLLLCGPPGLGKTTLAHVAAKHCGYRAVEINASDDRSSSTIESKILDVVEMNSLMADSKPKCLIIDEIDGALGDGKGAIEVIMKMVSAERKIEKGKLSVVNEGQSGNNSSRRRQKTSSLSRPVICICNDLYAPALRPLRQIAKVHIFVQPSVGRVVSRLKYICNKEGMSPSSIALTALAECTECDMRSCLNTLQFLNKKKETLNVVDISSQVVGWKDMSKSIFDIWKEIFQKRKFKHEKKSNHDHSSISREFDFLYSLMSSRGDYDLIMDGVYENMLHQQYHDPSMKKTVSCLNSVSESDLIHQYMMRSLHMHLQVYQPPIAITVHRLIAQVLKPKIEWPKSLQRFQTTLMEKEDILRTWKHKITPSISRHLSIKSFVEDLISPLMHVLSPPNLRPVAMHLLSESEKNDLTWLVSRMVSYCISYRGSSSELQPRNLKLEATIDANALIFDPPIGDYVSFKDHVPSHHVLAMAMKQVLFHEVEKQKILHGSAERSAKWADISKMENKGIAGTEAAGSKSSTHSVENFSMTNMENRENNGSFTASDASNCTIASSGATPGNANGTKDAKRPSNGSNYFDRFRKLNSTCSQKTENAAIKAVKSERASHPVLFKFNEGFTNAIKRPVRIRDFLR